MAVWSLASPTPYLTPLQRRDIIIIFDIDRYWHNHVTKQTRSFALFFLPLPSARQQDSHLVLCKVPTKVMAIPLFPLCSQLNPLQPQPALGLPLSPSLALSHIGLPLPLPRAPSTRYSLPHPVPPPSQSSRFFLSFPARALWRT